MSAIAAIVKRNGRPVEEEVVGDLQAQHGHGRGHVWCRGSVALAHRHCCPPPGEDDGRALLIDEAGYAITSDARLDNRSYLTRRLCPGRSPGDAALILHAYRRWGPACVERLLGDFAFVVWDPAERQLFVARDPLGARGLCYFLDAGVCVVASRIEQVLRHVLWARVPCRLNETKVAHYLAGLWYDQEATFYRDVLYCPPAHCLLVTADTVRRWRYWRLDAGRRIRYRDERAYAERLLALLREAVRCRMRNAGGSVGISLSGGLDSTSIAVLAAGAGHRMPLRSFSYVFDELRSCDERDFIRPVVARYGLTATYLPADGHWTLRDVDRWPMTAGFVMHDAYVWLPVSILAAARDAGCRLLLTGHFGDALFDGGRFWAVDLLRELRFKTLLVLMARQGITRGVRREVVRKGLWPILPPTLRRCFRTLRPGRRRRVHPGLHPRLLDRIRSRPPSDLGVALDRVMRRQGLTAAHWPQGVTAMRQLYHRFGLEPALPFWDRRLVEYVMAVPADQLGRPDRTKWMLREAMRGRLPGAVRERRDKTSFWPLFVRGIVERERDTVTRLLTDPEIVRRRFVREEWLRCEWEVAPHWKDGGHAFWRALSLELWLRRYWR